MRKILLPILLLMILICTGCGNNSTAENSTDNQVASAKVSGDLKITMLNVGQGDAFLIQTKSQNILIDTSDVDERDKLVSELNKAGVSKFDKIILTHPHADHIGGLEKLLKDEKFTVKEVYDNGIASSSKIYLNYMKAIKADKNIKHKTLSAGDNLDFGDGVFFEVLYPTKELVKAVNNGKQKSDPNNESVVGRLVYKNFDMMFTGDAEKEVESYLVENVTAKKLSAKILKSGHHGSYTASTKNFLVAIKPEYVLISAGEPTDKRGGNTYGHPHVEPLENYIAAGISTKNIFWTWKNGTVTITTDGKNISVQPEHKEDWIKSWIAEKKKSSKK